MYTYIFHKLVVIIIYYINFVSDFTCYILKCYTRLLSAPCPGSKLGRPAGGGGGGTHWKKNLSDMGDFLMIYFFLKGDFSPC